MFGLCKRPTDTNKLWLLNLHIGRGTNSEMPTDLAGAYVAAFVAATDHEAAARAVVAHLAMRGYEFLDISDHKIHQLDPQRWTSYVAESWPEFVSHFPTQGQVISGLADGKIFFGPFAGYEQREA
ncbi:hypothetical protein [Steroidobacter gossypii]|uniref:hypothetical protein n=1 Tax=Steroidobacter gossypii TaxID=2805490 RepID=UPI001C3F6B5F|nr:hypothetical protein [Steroidobacter gossypii]